MENIVVSFLLAHREYFYGFASAYALTHIPQAVAFLFQKAMMVPMLRAAVVANPKQAKAVIDAIRDELDKDIDAEAAAAGPIELAPAPAPAQSPAPGPIPHS